MVDANDPNGSDVRSEPARIVAIVTCHDRLEHLRATLPQVARAFEVLIVDYACPQRCGDWVRRFSEGAYDAIVRPHVHALSVEADPEGPPFWKPRALNEGAKHAIHVLKAERLLFLDADTMLLEPHELAAELAELEQEQFACGGRNAQGWDAHGLTGVLSCSDAAFLVAGGFDPIFKGWGLEDVDMRLELATTGGRPYWLRTKLRTIKHADHLRTKHRAPGFLPERSYAITRAAFLTKWSKRLGVELSNVRELPSELRTLCFHNATIGGVYG